MNPIDKRFTAIETLVVKVTNRCNLDCLYCYEHIVPKGQDMSIETFKSLAEKAIISSHSNKITFLFHGGEPTLLSNDWYREAITFANKLGEKHRKAIQYSIQTNLIAVSDEKIELFKKYKIQPGVSIDTIPGNETQRGKENKSTEKLKRLKNAGIRTGILSTINQSNFKHFYSICQYIHQELGYRQFKANVVYPVGNAIGKDYMQPEMIHEAETAILQYMIEHKGVFRETNLWLELERYFNPTVKQNSLCHDAVCGAGKKVMGISPTGAILPCGRFEWNDTKYLLGSMYSDNSNEYNFQLNKFLMEEPKNWQHCSKCEAKDMCRFSCQAFIVRSKEKLNIECLPTKMRYAHFKSNEAALSELFHSKNRNEENEILTLNSKH